jgi:bidirectional [NiFe] hydrogenase diaphorase subunit
MIVMDESDDMVDIARFFMEFCMEESCGKCVPCRAGTVQIHHLLTKIRDGRAHQADIELLRSLCDLVRNASLCGLGQSAPNPVISTLRYFGEEYTSKLKPDGPIPLPVLSAAGNGAGAGPVTGGSNGS